MVQPLPTGRVQRDLRIPSRVHLAQGVRMDAPQTPRYELETTAPPLLPRRLVAVRRRRSAVQPGADTHNPLPLPGRGNPHTVGEHDLTGASHTELVESRMLGQRARPVREAGRRDGPAETLVPRCGPTSQPRVSPGLPHRGVGPGEGEQGGA